MFVFKMTSQQDGCSNLEPTLGQACDHCKRRKMKCDRCRPCGVCRAIQATCSYESLPRRRGRPPRKTRRPVRHSQDTFFDPVPTASPKNWLSTPSCEIDHVPSQGIDVITTAPPTLDDATTSPCWAEADGLSEGSYGLFVPPTPAENTPTSKTTLALTTASTLSSQPALAPQVPDQDGMTQYPLSEFAHWTRVFLLRLYPVFPVLDPGCLLNTLGLPRDAVPRSMARFFAAMSAAVIVQLNLSAASEGEQPSAQLADKYIHQCMKGRQDLDFIEDADEWTILEAFFIFSYYGNRNKSKQAWYYLREAMGFALAMGLDREESYDDPDLEVNERRRRLYWLLFITERAYCLQHRTTCQLRASISLPSIYNGCDEPTLTGFITLARLFARIDTDFVSWWSEQSLRGSNDKLLDPEHFSAISHTSVVDETQRVDVAVTQCWLRTLVCQLRSQSRQSHGADEVMSLSAAARSLLICFNATRLDSLESHGIGMEQKISVIAGFLCDLVPNLEQDCLVGDINSIPNLLHEFMCLLSNFRNEESRYLGPLAERATALLIQRAGVGVLGPHGDECEGVEDKTLTW